jgi:hypothetical protein
VKSIRYSLKNIAENLLAEEHPSEEDFGFSLRNFLDGYNAAKPKEKRRLLEKEPPKLVDALGDGGVADAYLAALAVHLSRQDGISEPPWTFKKWRIPEKPWFALSSPEAKMWLLTESPGPFRERHLFLSADALSRA